MITCARCGTENLDGSHYCDECGMRLCHKEAPCADESAETTGQVWRVEATPRAGKRGLQRAHAKLIIERGHSAGKEFLLETDEAQIGRWDADNGIFPEVDLDADDPEVKVSRRHARIWRESGGYFIEDLGSTNGTYVNRTKRLLPGERVPLRDGDEIIVGKTFLRFHVIN
ncbi:FHA domain-containing protein [Pyrinomonas sp.]|uniref:FHA domain-containing protein n=1 Tax=Pyrinomonas sp. TaxID=2080306 RepID=UPI003333E3D9